MRTQNIIAVSLILIVLLADTFAEAAANRRRTNKPRRRNTGRDLDQEGLQTRGSGNRRRSNNGNGNGRDVDQDIVTLDDDFEEISPQERFLQENEDIENDWFEEE
ncbi:uncharacterized protein LOC102804405 [Saccoglossus kowalevskii]|uniref:Uncharacterized protein LOC102804405 n=1 Tax=Saccoglossus kowalevskii TaxID=10224 RepID=A0ABM0MZP3_SACKO|nr:PREDICTED: uncharacterized protein LOC102804405 [Saccoglossus kowalevskii]